MGFVNTKDKKLEVGGHYQYQEDRLTDFGSKSIQEVELIEDNSNNEYYKLKLKDLDDGEIFEVEMAKGNFYYGGMPRIWDEGEYV